MGGKGQAYVGYKGMDVVCWDAKRFLWKVRGKRGCSQLLLRGGFSEEAEPGEQDGQIQERKR